MRIALEAFFANTEKLTGVGHYIVETLKQIDKQNPGNSFYLLYTGNEWKGPDLGDNFIPVCYGRGKATPAILFSLKNKIEKIKPHIYHATFPTRVAPSRVSMPVVTTVHDLLPLQIEGFMASFNFRFLTLFAWKNSDHYLCNSEFTAAQLRKYTKIPSTKMTVTYLAPAFELSPWMPPGRHILFVGSMTKRKKPFFLLEVYKELCSMMDSPPPLIFVGDERDQGRNILECMNTVPGNGKVEWRHYVDAGEIRELYSNAAVFVLPSEIEGFGMPVIEAMSAGVPVLCSDIDIFREIAPCGAFRIEGWDKSRWAKHLKELLDNMPLRRKLSAEGLEHARKFSWEKCASDTWNVYKNLVENR